MSSPRKKGTHQKQLPVTIYEQHSVQKSRLQFVLPGENKLELKVGAVWHWTNYILIGGWISEICDFKIYIDNQEYTPEIINLPLQPPEGGFHFILSLPIQEGICIQKLLLYVSSQSLLFRKAFPLTLDAPDTWCNTVNLVTPVLSRIASRLKIFSDEWRIVCSMLKVTTSPCSCAAGALDYALHTAWTGDVIVTGWLSAVKDTQIWLEHDNGKTYAIEKAWRYYRKDVCEAVGTRYDQSSELAFIIALEDIPGYGHLTLKALATDGTATAIYTLGTVQIESYGFDTLAFAKRIFLPTIPINRFHEVAELIFVPIVSTCLEKQTEDWKKLSAVQSRYGDVPSMPLISVIVPLYGRIDFMDYQLAAFQGDVWFQKHAELIYVIDDPDIVSEVSIRAPLLYKIYGVPFRTIWGQINRGFSGANNLGAAYARADYLLFCNSDVFPSTPGWASELYTILHVSEISGAVGARLLKTDGSLQHAGMRFRFADELQVWLNEHPHNGCSSSLDPHEESAMVPVVTGACLCIRKSDFDAVGGWSSSYLLGDFEDSDLCMKLRQRGLKVLYAPHVQLTHLERQSFTFDDDIDFQKKLTVFNAVQHQGRWQAELVKYQEGKA